jgi:hypothetical protein
MIVTGVQGSAARPQRDSMRPKKSFREMSPAGRISASVLIAASVALVVAAERDIGGRSAAELRGSKPLWRLLCLNALGALGYFRWGRRHQSGGCNV